VRGGCVVGAGRVVVLRVVFSDLYPRYSFIRPVTSASQLFAVQSVVKLSIGVAQCWWSSELPHASMDACQESPRESFQNITS
jgi:hypothetical protein